MTKVNQMGQSGDECYHHARWARCETVDNFELGPKQRNRKRLYSGHGPERGNNRVVETQKRQQDGHMQQL